MTNPKQVDAMREGGKYLPLMKRQFHHRGEVYQVTIRPARLVDRQGVEKEYYPGIREELLEDALRKLALEQLNGAYFDNQAGVPFTISHSAPRKRQSNTFFSEGLLAFKRPSLFGGGSRQGAANSHGPPEACARPGRRTAREVSPAPLGHVGLINHSVPIALAGDAGTLVRGLGGGRGGAAARGTAWPRAGHSQTPPGS